MTWDWWEKERHRYRLVISEIVLEEAAAGDPQAADRRKSFPAGLDLFDLGAEVFRLASGLIDQRAVPTKARADALHIAVAAVNGADFLLTWNCKHINNAHTRKLINRVCLARGSTHPCYARHKRLWRKARMWEDPIVKEIHGHRQAMLDRFDGDLKALFDYLRDKQEKSGRTILKPAKRTPVES